MEELSVAVSDISNKTYQVSHLAEEGNQLSNQGEEFAKTVGEEMEGIKAATTDIAGMIQTIKTHMEQIKSVTAIIASISDETNLLALNAAIEAARAGDTGRGFAVVAEEVKQLVMESHQSAEKIEAMILNLIRESEQATEVIEKGQTQVSNGYTAVRKTLEIFNRIIVMFYDITKILEKLQQHHSSRQLKLRRSPPVFMKFIRWLRKQLKTQYLTQQYQKSHQLP
jgi:methyl-accepting chemotaxis protein